jgi:hypothetical protein
MCKNFLAAAFLFLFIPATSFAQTAPPRSNKLYIGFLDDDREEMANWKPGLSHHRLIRVAFEKTESGWQTVTPSSLPHRVKWTVAFDGKNLGSLEGQTGSESLTWVQTILAPGSSIPTVGAPSQDFTGLIAAGPGKVRRPLVLVSKPYFRDPDGWKRLAKLPPATASLVRSAFRRDFPRVDRCKDEEVVERNWKYPNSALKLLVVYRSNKKSFLVEVRLDAGNCGYVDDPNAPQSDPWFFMSSDGIVRRIGSFMSLLDAGDYDNEGKSELVFFLSQPEDTDGFVLFDSGLQKQASFTWTYH